MILKVYSEDFSFYINFTYGLKLLLFHISAYTKALDDALAVLDKIAMPVNVNDRKFTWNLLLRDPIALLVTYLCPLRN
jgi:hypothetical protein